MVSGNRPVARRSTMEAYSSLMHSLDEGMPGLEELSQSGDEIPNHYLFARELQRVMTERPNVRLRLTEAANTGETSLSEEFCNRVKEKLGPYVFEHHIQEVIKSGAISLHNLKLMHQIDVYSNPTGDYGQFFDDLACVSTSERELLLSNPNYFKTNFGFMSTDNQTAAIARLLQITAAAATPAPACNKPAEQ